MENVPADFGKIVTGDGPVAGIDIDGVLADPTHRLHYLSQRPRNWQGFFAGSRQDAPLATGIKVVSELADQGLQIVYVSGRPESLRDDTRDWFQEHGFPKAPMLLRPARDFRSAPVWKLEIYTRVREHREVEVVVDDDVRVVERLRGAQFNVRHAEWYQPPAEDKSRLARAQNKEGRT